MTWSRLYSCGRVSPLISGCTWPSSPFQTACKQSPMEAIRRLMSRPNCFRESALRPLDTSSFYSLSTPAHHFSTDESPATFSCVKVSRNGADVDSDHVIDQSRSSLPGPAGDAFEVLHPTLVHSSTFLQIFSQSSEGQDANDTFALVILNYELPLLTLFLWSKAKCRICADGGANQIYDSIPSLFPHKDPMIVRKHFKPDTIKGDLDSIRPEVKEFYSGLGTKILDDCEDQETTDLWKCVAYAVDSLDEMKKGHMKLLVLGALGGRLDHTMANLNTLYLFKEVQIVLLSDESMAFLLPKGYRHEIWIDSSLEGPYCGLLPLGGPSLCTTTEGLQWNLTESSLQFGGIISTSNRPVGNRVTVSSDVDLLWTISLRLIHSQMKEQINSSNLVLF